MPEPAGPTPVAATQEVTANRPPDRRPGPTLADALAASLTDAHARLVRSEALAREGDGEGVHQVRVALRRLRSDLRTLGDASDPDWRARVEPMLRSTATALGDARDLDVLLKSARADVRETELRAFAPVIERLEARRTEAHETLRRALDEPAYADLQAILLGAVRALPVGPAAPADAETALPTIVIDAWTRLERRANDLGPDSPDEAFHRTRIAAKRARYIAELAGRVLSGKRAAGAARLAEQIARVQEQLGTIQDAVVAEATIRAMLPGRRSVPFAFAAGRLVERQRAHADAARAAFFKVWPKVRRKRWRTWAA